jgi:hypothetical protein
MACLPLRAVAGGAFAQALRPCGRATAENAPRDAAKLKRYAGWRSEHEDALRAFEPPDARQQVVRGRVQMSAMLAISSPRASAASITTDWSRARAGRPQLTEQ